MSRPRVGISLHADRAFLARHRTLIEHDAELFEVMPESLWQEGARPGPAWQLFRDLRERSERPFVGHGTLLSIGAAVPPPRRRQWLDALRRDQEAFEFAWFSDHLGFADCGDRHVALPLPLPATESAADVCASTLTELHTVFPLVAFENNVGYFSFGDPLEELRLFARVGERAGAAMVLDLHNAYTTCRNAGVDLDAWLERIDFGRVVEIHLSGGSDSDPDWLPSRRVFRLDSHDGPVPEPVWAAYEAVLPRCTALRGIIVEQGADGAPDDAASFLAEDFARARSIRDALPSRTPEELPAPRAAFEAAAEPSLIAIQRTIVEACSSADPAAAVAEAPVDAAARDWLAALDPDGLRLTALLVQKLRFERLTRGDPRAFDAFERDPRGFTNVWREFAREVPPEVFPEAEARAFAAFAAERG